MRAHGIESQRVISKESIQKVDSLINDIGLTSLIDVLTLKAAPANARQIGPIGSIFFRSMHFSGIGSRIIGHLHNYDHATFISLGSLACIFRDQFGNIKEEIYNAPAIILIKKDIWHEFTALSDRVEAHCIFAHRDKEGQVVQDWNENYLASQTR